MGSLPAEWHQVITTGLLLWSFEVEGGTERGLRARLLGLLTALLERSWLLISA
jgi:hypothetical protein